MPIEFTPKPKVQIPKLWIAFLVAAIILIVVGLGVWYYLWSAVNKVVEEIGQIDRALVPTAEEKDLERIMLSWQKKINDFSSILSRDPKTLNVLSLLERISHPRVWISQFSLNPDKKILTLVGRADSSWSLGQQLDLLKGDSSINNINLAKVSVNDRGEVDFSLDIIFNPGVFK